MSAITHDELQTPPPLEFLLKDKIHESNQRILDEDEQRWRLLTWAERFKLRRYVRQLQRDLNKRGYNRLVIERAALIEQYQAARKVVLDAIGDDEQLQQAKVAKRAIAHQLKAVIEQLQAMQEQHERYTHYRGWLEYERQHRKDLKVEAKREKRIRSEMRKESQWLEQLLLDVFRRAPKCHHITTDGKGREINLIPRFQLAQIRPDAHYFYLLASKRTLFGWRWMLPPNVMPADLHTDEVLEAMRAATHREVSVGWTEQNQLYFRVSRLDSPDALPKNVLWRDAMRYYPQSKDELYPYCIGITEGRKFEWFDLVSDPHILVAGKSQSGKSNLVNGIIATLVSTHSPNQLRVVLIDQKGGIEFTHWSELPHLLWEMIKTVDGVEPALDHLVAVMRRRMTLLEKAKAKDIAAYNARVDIEHHLERVLVVIDEMNTFVGLGKQTEDIHNLIMLLTSQGRAVGVHVIACTQHPEVKVIPGRIKTNMSVRISGVMPTITASQIVIDRPDAARLPNIPGRLAAVVGLKTLVVQAPRLYDEDIAGVVGAARRKHPDVANDLHDLDSDAPKLTVWDEQRVMQAALEWLSGHLSGQKLHKMLGDESPGERHLAKVCRQIIDAAQAIGYAEHNDERYCIKKRGKAYYLELLRSDESDRSDEQTV